MKYIFYPFLCLLLLSLGLLYSQTPTGENSPRPRHPSEIADQITREAQARPANKPSRLAVQVAVKPDETLIPLTEEVIAALDPEDRFSLGLDKLIRQEFDPLNHENILVVTNRLALDSEGRHLLESLLVMRKPIVQRVVVFNDELPPPARTPAMDRILAGYPDIRVYERSSRAFRLPDSVFEGIDIVLVDMALRPGQFYPEANFLQGVLLDASVHDKKIVVLDRPYAGNAIVHGGPVGDPRLHESINSFFPMFTLSALTTGEIATLLNNYYGLGMNLEVLTMSNWSRTDGYKPLLETYKRLGIDPSSRFADWEAYIPGDVLIAQWQTIGDLLPEGKVKRVEAASGEEPVSLIVDPAPLTPQDFVEKTGSYKITGLTAAAKNDGDEGLVALSSPTLLENPVFTSVALWDIWSDADSSVLPEEGNVGSYGTAFVFDALREGRHPSEILRLWRLSTLYDEMEQQRKRSLLY